MPERWTAETIPPELAAILDAPGGTSLQGLVEILNRYDEMRDVAAESSENYWYADSDGEFEHYPWTPRLDSSRGCQSMQIWFLTREECEAFIRNEILPAARMRGSDDTERERPVHQNPELAAQIREGIAEAERGETTHLGSFAQYLLEENDD